jgi:hypothetical protein
VILPDNDAPGRAHAEVVAASLEKLAKSIHILELPDLPPKGDIIDWDAAGGTVEELKASITHDAKLWWSSARPTKAEAMPWESEPRDQLGPATDEKIKAALSVIDPDIERSKWINIGYALFDALGDEKGGEFFDNWSSRNGNYDPRENKYDPRTIRSDWRSIASGDSNYHGRRVTIATLFHYATEADPNWWRTVSATDGAARTEISDDEDPLSYTIREGENGRYGGDRSQAEFFVLSEMLRRGYLIESRRCCLIAAIVFQKRLTRRMIRRNM